MNSVVKLPVATVKKSTQFVTFHVAGQVFGIPVEMVQEILPPQSVTNVPMAPDCIAGLINLRGQIVTSFDLRIRLGLASRHEGSGYINIISGAEDDLYALVVDSVGDVIAVESSQFSLPPPTLDPVWRDCCCGVYQLETGLLISLDIKNLFSIQNLKKQSPA